MEIIKLGKMEDQIQVKACANLPAIKKKTEFHTFHTFLP